MNLPAGFVIVPATAETRGRKRRFEGTEPERKAASQRKIRTARKSAKLENIAVLDMETDPFDNLKPDMRIEPFCACLYSDNFEPVIIWENDVDTFAERLFAAINALPEQYTIYAHNGGKFDYMFLVHKLRGPVSFKGRGIMSARIGQHELRDSYHIIPERLANWKKDDFDYSKMKRSNRERFRQEIVDYLINDCRYLLEIVKDFVQRFGLKLSIGQAAIGMLKQFYTVEHIGPGLDESLRPYFFGGRVECLAGKGHFVGPYRMYDVNSMYPSVMAECLHPVSNSYEFGSTICDNTVFVDVTCDNYGALVRRNEDNETTATTKNGRFLTTIHEFNAALELDLIDHVRINRVINCERLSNFSDFVLPLYEDRQRTKALLKTLPEGSREYNEAKKDDIFIKLLLNNSYGKFAQNPRRYKESYITDPDAPAPEGYEASVLPVFQCDKYAIWERPAPKQRFNNVGTAASITGAARAKLLRAIAGAIDPIYCDTDSLICREISGVEINPSKLGAWDLEAEFSEVLIAGKKLYACKFRDSDKVKIRSKGVSGMTWGEMLKILDGEIISLLNKAPTLTKTGNQFYMQRRVRATAPTRHNRRYTANWRNSA